MKNIPLSVPNLKGNELEYVTNALKDEWVSTGGEYIDKFEKDMAKYLKVENSVAVQSGTAGLHLSLTLSGVGYKDEVIVPTLTFIAAVNPVKYVGAEPIFMDCDDTLNMDLNKLEKFCKDECILTDKGLINKNTKRIIKAIVVVYVFGNMIDIERLMNIAREYKLKVIEDSTEALGTYVTKGKYKEKFAGTIGDFGVYSFNGNKIITTGGGGMIVANDLNLLDKAKYLSTQAKDDTLYYVHDEIGYNYRMTNLQAALGVAQLERLEEFIETKIENYKLYKKEIEKIDGLSLLQFNQDARSNHWFYSLVIDEKEYGISRDQLLNKLQEEKIQTRPIWGLIHHQKPYMNSRIYNIEKSEEYIEKILNIPCSTNLLKREVEYVCNVLNDLKR